MSSLASLLDCQAFGKFSFQLCRSFHHYFDLSSFSSLPHHNTCWCKIEFRLLSKHRGEQSMEWSIPSLTSSTPFPQFSFWEITGWNLVWLWILTSLQQCHSNSNPSDQREISLKAALIASTPVKSLQMRLQELVWESGHPIQLNFNKNWCSNST